MPVLRFFAIVSLGLGLAACSNSKADSPGGGSDANTGDGSVSDGPPLAFPSAVGAGAYATGGRGGQVLHVTNLDASGPGSFYEALQTAGPRIIVFDVGGVIDMRAVTGFYVPIMKGSDHDNVTIAGETAPGGITLEGYSFFFDRVDNVVMRYVRVKHVSIDGKQEDAAFIRGNDIIFDHCTFLNGKDETISMYDTVEPMGRVTLQNSLIGNGKTGMIMGGTGGEFADTTFSLVGNLFVDISHRFPNTSAKSDSKYDVINNVVYSAKLRYMSIYGNEGNASAAARMNINYINNYNKTSGYFTSTYEDYNRKNFHQISEYGLDPENKQFFSSGNIVTGWHDTPQVDDWDLWTNFNFDWEEDGYWVYEELKESPWFTSTQNPLLGNAFTIKSAQDAYDEVVVNSGANAYLDDNHQRVVYTEVQEDYLRQKVVNDSATAHGGYDAANASYGNTHEGLTRPKGWSTQADGIPDTWKLAKGLDVDTDYTTFVFDSGYVGIEEYLHEIE